MPLSNNQIEKMKEKRKRILEEAITLFSEEGYNDTTIAKVAKAADVSFGSVFTYFKNKEELFNSAVIEPLDEFKEVLFNFSTEAEDPLAELEQMVINHIKYFAHLGNYLRLVAIVVGQYSKFPNQFTELDNVHQEFREKLSILIINGQHLGQLRELNPKNVATSYLSFLIGLRLTLADAPDHEVWQEFVSISMQLFGPKK